MAAPAYPAAAALLQLAMLFRKASAIDKLLTLPQLSTWTSNFGRTAVMGSTARTE